MTVLAYSDGGMHSSFRDLLKTNGPDKLAASVSDIKYPVSRPMAALANPFAPLPKISPTTAASEDR